MEEWNGMMGWARRGLGLILKEAPGYQVISGLQSVGFMYQKLKWFGVILNTWRNVLFCILLTLVLESSWKTPA